MLDEFLKFDAILEPDSRWSESQLELELAKVIMAFVKTMFANCYRWCSRKRAVMQRKYKCSRRTNLTPCTLWCLHSSSSIFWKDKSVKCKSSHADQMTVYMLLYQCSMRLHDPVYCMPDQLPGFQWKKGSICRLHTLTGPQQFETIESGPQLPAALTNCKTREWKHPEKNKLSNWLLTTRIRQPTFQNHDKGDIKVS